MEEDAAVAHLLPPPPEQRFVVSRSASRQFRTGSSVNHTWNTVPRPTTRDGTPLALSNPMSPSISDPPRARASSYRVGVSRSIVADTDAIWITFELYVPECE